MLKRRCYYYCQGRSVLPRRFTETIFCLIFALISDISDLKCAWLTPLGVYSVRPDPQLLVALFAAASRFPFHN